MELKLPVGTTTPAGRSDSGASMMQPPPGPAPQQQQLPPGPPPLPQAIPQTPPQAVQAQVPRLAQFHQGPHLQIQAHIPQQQQMAVQQQQQPLQAQQMHLLQQPLPQTPLHHPPQQPQPLTPHPLAGAQLPCPCGGSPTAVLQYGGQSQQQQQPGGFFERPPAANYTMPTAASPQPALCGTQPSPAIQKPAVTLLLEPPPMLWETTKDCAMALRTGIFTGRRAQQAPRTMESNGTSAAAQLGEQWANEVLQAEQVLSYGHDPQQWQVYMPQQEQWQWRNDNGWNPQQPHEGAQQGGEYNGCVPLSTGPVQHMLGNEYAQQPQQGVQGVAMHQ